MKRYNFVLITVILLSMLLFVNFSFKKKVNGFHLKIINETEIVIKGLKFEFKNENKIIDITEISSKEVKDLVIETRNISTETILSLNYVDKDGQKIYNTIVPYLEKGYSGKGTIKIISVDKSGQIEIDVKFKYL